MTFRKAMMIALAISGAAVAAQAQNSSSAVMNAQEQPVTQTLNAGVAADAAATDAVNAERQRQYELDRAAFRAEVAARKEKIMNDQDAYARQQAAYADAMSAWRMQSDACKHGDMKACKARTPVPADFYIP